MNFSIRIATYWHFDQSEHKRNTGYKFKYKVYK